MNRYCFFKKTSLDVFPRVSTIFADDFDDALSKYETISYFPWKYCQVTFDDGFTDYVLNPLIYGYPLHYGGDDLA